MTDQAEFDKSEQATPFKLSKAREKGTVARGVDLGFAVALATVAGYLWVNGGQIASAISLDARRALVAAPNVVDSPNELLAVAAEVVTAALRPMAFLVAAAFAAVLVFELVQTGVVFSTEPLRLDFGRLSPARGLKRVFSIETLIQAAKNLLKFAVYAAVAFWVIRGETSREGAAISDARDLVRIMAHSGLKLMVLLAGLAVAFAILDQIIVRRLFQRRMRMSRREIKRERRDREGEPRLKLRRKQLHAEFVKLSQSVRGIRGADILVTNPTHFAVGLKYDPKTMAAPRVVALGANHAAIRLKRLAFLYGVVIVEQRNLARALYQQSKINKPIPEAYYRIVADLYLTMQARARASGTAVLSRPRHV